MQNKEKVKSIIRERAKVSRTRKYKIPDQMLKDADWLWSQYFCDKGPENSIRRTTLETMTGWPDRYVRKIISVLKHTKRMVCNSRDGRGYFAPRYLDEAIPYVLSENRRKRSDESNETALLNCLDSLPVRPGMEDIDGSGEIQHTAL